MFSFGPFDVAKVSFCSDKGNMIQLFRCLCGSMVKIMHAWHNMRSHDCLTRISGKIGRMLVSRACLHAYGPGFHVSQDSWPP